MLVAALVGFLVGWLGSVPVAGPISALVVTRGIEGRFRSGALIALGGGIVEALYAFLAFWGFSSFLTEYPVVVPISRAAAAVILLALGIALLRARPTAVAVDAPAPNDSPAASFFLGASICALNPTLLATWTAVVTTLYSSGLGISPGQAIPFALGACLGIAGWFVALLALIRHSKERFSPAALARVVRGIGVLILVLAVWFGWRFASYFFEA